MLEQSLWKYFSFLSGVNFTTGFDVVSTQASMSEGCKNEEIDHVGFGSALGE